LTAGYINIEAHADTPRLWISGKKKHDLSAGKVDTFHGLVYVFGSSIVIS